MADFTFNDSRPAAVTNVLSRWLNLWIAARPSWPLNNWAICGRVVQTSQMPVNGMDGSR